MCFSAEISFGIAATGAAASYYMQRQGATYRLTVPLYFFCSMEFLQGVQYFTLNMCGDPVNEFLTQVGWLHICAQPFFFNMWISWFIPDKEKSDLYFRYVCGASFIAFLFLASRLYVPDGRLCHMGMEMLCGPVTCAYQGQWHIAWDVALRGASYSSPSIFLHAFLMFVPGMLAGRWVITGSVMLLGALLPMFLVRDFHEAPVLWCFFSTVQLLVSLRTFQFYQKLKGHGFELQPRITENES